MKFRVCPLPACQGDPVPDMSAEGQCRDRPSVLDTPGMNASAPPPPKPWAKGRAHYPLHGVQTRPLLEANRSRYHTAGTDQGGAQEKAEDLGRAGRAPLVQEQADWGVEGAFAQRHSHRPLASLGAGGSWAGPSFSLLLTPRPSTPRNLPQHLRSHTGMSRPEPTPKTVWDRDRQSWRRQVSS